MVKPGDEIALRVNVAFGEVVSCGDSGRQLPICLDLWIRNESAAIIAIESYNLSVEDSTLFSDARLVREHHGVDEVGMGDDALRKVTFRLTLRSHEGTVAVPADSEAAHLCREERMVLAVGYNIPCIRPTGDRDIRRAHVCCSFQPEELGPPGQS